MKEKETNENQSEDSAAFDRRFKCAVVAFAIIEFIVIVFVVYKAGR